MFHAIWLLHLPLNTGILAATKKALLMAYYIDFTSTPHAAYHATSWNTPCNGGPVVRQISGIIFRHIPPPSIARMRSVNIYIYI